MKVFINEREFDYTSDYPVDWKFVSKDYFKFPVYFGNAACFVKRFQLRPQNALVWELLGKLRFKNERNLPKIHDVVSVVENRMEIRYVFYEFIEGSTLDKVLLRGSAIDLERLTHDLFSALESVHRHGFWFTDLCEKNIFCDTKGKFRLIDVDSCLPLSEAPNNDLDVNMFYYALVYKFYREILQLQIKPADISGNSLNHLQVIFLVLNLKINAVSHTQDFYSDEIFDDLPPSLNSVDSGFKTLFKKVLDGTNSPDSTHDVQEIKQMIIEKIIYPGTAKNKQEERLPEKPVIEISPTIVSFTASSNIVRKGHDFSLKWDVRDAEKVIIKRNGIAFSQPRVEDSQMTVTESSDGKNKEISFSLVALRQSQKVESAPLTITVYDTIKIVEETRVDPVIPKRTKIKWRGIAMAGLALLALGLLFIFLQKPAAEKASISGFAPKSVRENRTIVISGRNFPNEPSLLKVFFNQVQGDIQYSSDRLIRVKVPELGTQLGNGLIRVAVVIQKDTVFTPEALVIKK